MSSDGRQSSPEFDETRYERPQKDWLCGHACEGCPCRAGPGPEGQCRAGPECKPLLVAAEGEAKGLWKCTRTADSGGPCAEGPRPDGACCRVTPPCVPVRSLRSRRGLLARCVVFACVGLLLVAVLGPWRSVAINPGPLTAAHSSPAFALAHAEAGVSDPKGCAHCHAAAHADSPGLLATAISVGKGDGPLSVGALLGKEARDFGAMDAACQSCHMPHSFHQANVARDTSCSVCHLEHQGRGKDLMVVDSVNCTACHGDSGQMSAAAKLSRDIPADFFERKIVGSRTAFSVPRPAEGLTARITSFAGDHPEFRLVATHAKDPNPLAFNHAKHLDGDAIPLLEGNPLDCRSCHEPDASGLLMKPVRFDLHCQACHGLPVDPATPTLSVPHGSAENARAFLRALPAAYTDDAVRRLGLSGRPLLDHVSEKLAAFQRLHPSGEELERKVFFGSPSAPAGRDSCNLCHIVEAAPAGAAPRIAPVRMAGVWMPRARFNHAQHTQVSCSACHAVKNSVATADILMPSKNTCASCHGPEVGVTDSCTACHGYHNPLPTGVPLSPSSPLPAQLQRALAAAP